MVHSGLEPIASDEITRDLGGDVKKAARGIVAFRVEEITPDILRLRTTEDVFVLAWGSDSLTYRADDIDQIRRWTQKADWDRLLKIHHAIRPKPKSRPSYRLVTQMIGEHGYRRADAHKALIQGASGIFPTSWREADDNASVEIWLTIRGAQAVCGLRLSDRAMRHRRYKQEHLPASLRPTIAAAMVRLAGAGPAMVIVDPMCGAGTILAEQLDLASARRLEGLKVLGGDIDGNALRAAATNLKRFGSDRLCRWDATRLPLGNDSVDRIICNPPFGRQLGTLDQIGPLYRLAIREFDRVLRPGGRAVLLVGEPEPLREAIDAVEWSPQRKLTIRVQGLPAQLSVWRKREA
jgi:23S rRNA G2445 N2-methylase RlmL